MNMRTFTVTKEQYDFIIMAIEAYIDTLRQRIADDAMTNMIEKANKTNTITVSSKSVKTKEAPFGYKKDGTPKKRPGRAPRKEAK